MTGTSPHASIIVPTRGGATRLPTLLNALRSQTDADWEAIIVIDGDIDDSNAVVRRYSSTLPVRVVNFTENRGRSAALNAGFEAADGTIMIRCDDDLVPDQHFVERHAKAHEGRDVGVVGLYRNLYPETTYADIYGRAWDLRFRAEAYSTAPDRTWQYWAGNCSVTRRRWMDVGPYDVTFRSYGWEDVDWGYRLANLGVRVVLDRELETEHRIAAVTTGLRAQRAFYAGAAKATFERKHGIARETRPGLPWNWLVSATSSVLNERRVEAIGRAVDAAARRVPQPVAQKSVALLVEASSYAGQHRGGAGSAI